MLIPTGQTNENHDPPRRPPNNIPTITKAIDSDTRYTCLLPSDWNGGLVMYLQLSSRPPLADSLCQEWFRRGYALAIAQYSGKGQLDQAGHHRRQLLSFFARRCGTPQQVCEISDTPGENPPT
jgi:hypothetical protein